jgi:hypothetical protein
MQPTELPGHSSLHGWLLVAGLFPAAALVGRLVYDLGGLGVVYAIPLWGFYLGFLVVGTTHAVRSVRGDLPPLALGKGQRAALAFAIPVGLTASIMDCMGLEFRGCTTICNLLVQVASPALSALVLLQLATGRRGLLTAASALLLLFIVPNCVCYNPVNGPWIDLLGKSPACFAGSFAVSLLALGALRTGRMAVASITIVWLTNATMLAFFVGHHFYGVPW